MCSEQHVSGVNTDNVKVEFGIEEFALGATEQKL